MLTKINDTFGHLLKKNQAQTVWKNLNLNYHIKENIFEKVKPKLLTEN